MADTSKSDTVNDRLRDVWQELCRSLGIVPTRQAAMWNELVERHAEAWRHYHTLTHVEALVATLLQLMSEEIVVPMTDQNATAALQHCRDLRRCYYDALS